MNPILEILEGANAILSDESHWTKGAYARDHLGVSVLPRGNANFRSYCLSGALMQASYDRPGSYGFYAARALVKRTVAEMYPDNLGTPSFNDNLATTFQDVKRVLAAAKAKVTTVAEPA